MKTAEDFLRPVIGPEPTNVLTYAQALAAVQAVMDHYDPLPGKLELAYRVVDPPADTPRIRLGCCRTCGEARQQCANTECPGASPFPRVFPPACPRCLQRGAECLCPTKPTQEEPPF